MAITNEVWAGVVQDVLFQDDLKFTSFATSDDSYINYKTVNLPQAGGGIGVFKNYAGSYPMAVTQRVDTTTTYTVDEYLTNVTIIKYSEELQTSYPKQASIAKQMVGSLSQVIGTEIIKAWAPATATGQVFTSGATSSLFLEGSQTGTRKLPVMADFINLKRKLDNDLIPQNGRVLMVPATLHAAMLNVPEIANAMNFYGNVGQNTLPEGVVNRLLGFDVMVRQTVLAFGSGLTASALSPAVDGDGKSTGLYTIGASDNIAGLAWHPDFVRKAWGGVQIAQSATDRDPVFGHGCALSGLAMMGAAKSRTSGVGVAALIFGA